ncbi:MAG: hypothetical protein KDD43_00595, partial [Bdellovibrionales bacterium]|nr:hypothetical protein [Bdellovibrionales bacterium]
MRDLYLFLGLLLIASGCARPLFTSPFVAPPVRTSHRLNHMPLEQQRPILVHLPSGEYETGDLFSLLPLTSLMPQEQSGTLRRYFEVFYRGERTYSSTKFSESPFGEFLIENSITPFVMNTYNLDEQRGQQLQNVRLLLQRRSWYLKQSSAKMPAMRLVAVAQKYVDQTLADFAIGKLEPKIRDGVIAGIRSFQVETLLPTAKSLSALDSTRQLGEALTILRQLIQDMNITLEPETEEQFKVAEKIALRISQAQDEKSALALLVEVWDQMSPEDRGPAFKRASPDLYKFMKDSSQDDRNCLKGLECTGFGTQIAKHLFILPAIKDYGISNLRDQIEVEVLNTMKFGVKRMIRDSLIDLPRLLHFEIQAEIDKEFDRIEGYTNDYPSFVRGELNSWYRNQFGTSFVPAIETESIKISNSRRGPIIEGIGDSRGRLTVSAHSLGRALSSTQHWPKEMAFIRPSTEQKNLILLGLVRANQILGFESMLRTADQGDVGQSAQVEEFDFTEQETPMTRMLPLSFFPHRASLKQGFGLSNRSHLAKFDVSGQASLLRGFVSLARLFNDWEPTPLSRVMASISLKEMIPNLPSDTLNISAFSQEVLLAKALSNAGLILKTLKSRGTPLFQICEDRQPLWLDEDKECAWPSSLVGLVDIEEGK